LLFAAIIQPFSMGLVYGFVEVFLRVQEYIVFEKFVARDVFL